MPATLSDKSNRSSSSLSECSIGNTCLSSIHSRDNPEIDIILQFYKWGIQVSNIFKNMIQTFKVNKEWEKDLNTRFTPKAVSLNQYSILSLPRTSCSRYLKSGFEHAA